MENPSRNRKRICRLCLIKCDTFDVIEENTKNNMDMLQLKINLPVSEEPVICTNCAEIIQKCFDFKQRCLDSYDCLISFNHDKNVGKLSLNSMHLNREENFPEDHDICGFCTCIIKNYPAICLDNEGDSMLQMMLEKCLPELDFSVVKKPVICPICHGSLVEYFRFVTNCFIVEEKIKKYCEALDLNSEGQIELSSVLQFTIRDITSEVGGKSVDIIKVEEQCVRKRENTNERKSGDRFDTFKLEEKVCEDIEHTNEEIDTKNKSFMDKGGLEFKDELQFSSKNTLSCKEESDKFDKESKLVELEDEKFLVNEEIEIKAEEQGFNSFEDGTVLPQPNSREKRLTQNLEENRSNSYGKRTSTNENGMKTTLNDGDSSSYLQQYKDHLKSNSLAPKRSSKKNLYKCDFCFYQTTYRSNLKQHSMVHKDPSEVKMHTCITCSYQTKYSSYLKKHSLKHKKPSELTMYSCGSCLFQTRYQGNVKKHLLGRKDPPEVKTYKCGSCSFRTNCKHHLRMHSSKHEAPPEAQRPKTRSSERRERSGVAAYACNSCSYQSNYKSALKTHSMVHKEPSEVTTYTCDSCLYRTNYKQDLKRHLVRHMDPSEVTMHACNSCRFQTKYASALKRHLLLHENSSDVTACTCDSYSFHTKHDSPVGVCKNDA